MHEKKTNDLLLHTYTACLFCKAFYENAENTTIQKQLFSEYHGAHQISKKLHEITVHLLFYV